jgi:hypothetical protein
MKECMGDDASRASFERCLNTIVTENDGKVEGVWYESSAKIAHVHVSWTTLDQRRGIMYDLGAVDDGDLLTGEDVDSLVEERGAP